MNIWDSVQRGLEKASNEAARIARIQRLRSTIDNLNRQVSTQQDALLARAIETFLEGRMVQPELLPICQELVSLQQRLAQAQSELKLQQQQASSPTTQTASDPTLPATPITGPGSGNEAAPTVYTPPPPPYYQPYADPTMPVPVPPPPPGVEPFDISTLETKVIEGEAQPVTGKRLCPTCGEEALPGHAYCQNCGAFLEGREAAHLPTVRASNSEGTTPPGGQGEALSKPEEDQGTIRGPEVDGAPTGED